MKRIPELDGIRGIAILLVLVYHLMPAKLHNGWLGVDVFFVLSGFLITSLLLSEWDKRHTIDFKSFYFRRALRLLPALTAMLTVYAALVSVWGQPWPRTLRAVIAVQFYFANYASQDDLGIASHAWSLAVEEHFYLLWPVALAFMLRRCSLRQIGLILSAFIVAVALWRAGFFWITGSHHHCYFSTDAKADTLLAGCLAAIVNRQGLRIPRATVAVAVVLIAVSFSLPAYSQTGAFALGWSTVFAVAAAALLLWVVRSQGPLSRLLACRSLGWTGRISYSLYLWHPLVIAAVARTIGGQWTKAATVATVALCFAVAALSYYGIEQPFLKFKDRKPVTANPTRLQPEPTFAPSAGGFPESHLSNDSATPATQMPV